MLDELKLILFRIIYEKLKLDSVEKRFLDYGLKPKQIVSDGMNYKNKFDNKFFFLKSDVHLENLSLEEITLLKKYMSSEKAADLEELYHFLENNCLKLLIPKTDKKYLIWEPGDFRYAAPSDSIVLAFHYIEFDDSYDDNLLFMVSNELNRIQKESVDLGFKTSVLEYNEVMYDWKMI